MPDLQPIVERPQTLTDHVYGVLREAITSRTLKPGERITEAALAERLSVSKTPVREALVRLAQVGLIQMGGDGRTTHVVRPSTKSIREAYELRAALEIGAVRLATQRADSASLGEIRELAESSLAAAQAGDRDQFRWYDVRFHMAIAHGADNSRLLRLIGDVLDLATALRIRDVPNADGSVSCAQQHIEIAEAMESGDTDAAVQAMRGHLEKVQAMVLSGGNSSS